MSKKPFLFIVFVITLFFSSLTVYWEESMPTLYSDSWSEMTDSWVSTPIYSPNWNHFVYTVQKDDKTAIVVDWKELSVTFDEIDTSFFWVLNNKSVYLKAKSKKDDKRFFVFKWYKSELFDELNIYVYWDNSDMVSWSARNWNNWYTIYNKTVTWPYDYVDTYPTTSTDYSKFVFKVTKDEKSTAVLNGKELVLPSPYNLDYVQISPDSKKMAFVVLDNDWYSSVILWSKIFKRYSQINWMTFSPDSKQLIYVWVNEEWKNTIIANWEDHKTYDSIWTINFSNSGNHIYYVVTDWNYQYVVVDWQPQKKYDSVDYPSYSQDERYLIYFAKNWNNWVLVVNWKEIQP